MFVLLGQIAGLGGPRDPGNQPLSRLIGSFADPTFWKTFSASAAVVLIAAAALLFDTMTSRVVAVDFFYVAILLVAFWYPSPKAPLILAPLASILIIVGLWLAIPDNVPMWENWLNRLSAIATVWLTALFVWYIRLLGQKLALQIAISEALSREVRHRVGNSLQLVASFLRLRAANTKDAKSRDILKAAAAQVVAIGKLQRMLSHTGSTGLVNSESFIKALVDDLCGSAPERDAIHVTVEADAAELPSTTAVVLGALMSELINNALKHAFRGIERGTLAVRFYDQQNLAQYVVEVEDDGVGLSPSVKGGYGLDTVTELTRLMGGTITHEAVHPSGARPGTRWRLVVPHG